MLSSGIEGDCEDVHGRHLEHIPEVNKLRFRKTVVAPFACVGLGGEIRNDRLHLLVSISFVIMIRYRTPVAVSVVK